MTKPTSPDDNKQVANRAMVQAAVLAAVVLLCIVAWLAFDFLLLLFASILFGVLILMLVFKSSEKLAAAYGLAVTATIILVLALFFVALNLLVDVLQTIFDPRIERG